MKRLVLLATLLACAAAWAYERREAPRPRVVTAIAVVGCDGFDGLILVYSDGHMLHTPPSMSIDNATRILEDLNLPKEHVAILTPSEGECAPPDSNNVVPNSLPLEVM